MAITRRKNRADTLRPEPPEPVTGLTVAELLTAWLEGHRASPNTPTLYGIALRLHDPRHTHASFLISAGENPIAISERLGHRRVSTTLDIYGHLMEDMQNTTAVAMGRMIRSDRTGTDDVRP